MDEIPNPEYLIKSIAEQGYSLETAIADLIDNSISADATMVEILIDYESTPFKLFIADNGNGMNMEDLKKSMRFPSNCIDNAREQRDLGRFGLGMKTASFSQTRKFTVLSRINRNDNFNAKAWDVNYLKKEKKWKTLTPSDQEIDIVEKIYEEISNSFIGRFDNFEPKTIVYWEGLFKFEEYIDVEKQEEALRSQISGSIYNHLSLVFHRFLESKEHELSIRINNRILKAFNPFPTFLTDFHSVEYMEKVIGDGRMRVEGFVLPSRSIKETREDKGNIWVQEGKSLMDMEGIYIYRANRVIYYGGWSELVKKSPRMQLARLRVEVGNDMDHLLHLNVAKSKIKIPLDLTSAFTKYILELKTLAEKEYFNRENKSATLVNKGKRISLFNRIASNQGILLEVNKDFPLLSSVIEQLDSDGIKKLNFVFRMINIQINKIKKIYRDVEFVGNPEKDGVSEDDILGIVENFLNDGFCEDTIVDEVLPALGFKLDSLPDAIQSLIKKEKKNV